LVCACHFVSHVETNKQEL